MSHKRAEENIFLKRKSFCDYYNEIFLNIEDSIHIFWILKL